ncbi:hypothetical protein SAY86_031654 [Trapa natans]|uniref:Anaphase-promoting complex subunit 4 WD40 domain-containing protein n=1 Tax=Trapa natans TaxID=22666 RepID=A0AAN7M7G1_TRANT|nr:hypothetical protein SAY86_031654 [Trapa natans]
MYSTAQSNISAVLVYCKYMESIYCKYITQSLKASLGKTRILTFKNQPPVPVELIPTRFHLGSAIQGRQVPQLHPTDAPDLVDDYYLNLMDWGSSNTVYLWDTSSRSTSELVTVDDEGGPVTNISWASDGRHVAVGLNNSEVQLWDSTANRLGCALLSNKNKREPLSSHGFTQNQLTL